MQAMFDSIAPSYDRANTVLSFGIHYLWRHLLLRTIPKSMTSSALDLCTGTGDLLPGLSKRCGRVVGVDFSREMIISGQAKWRNLSSVIVVQGDGLRMPVSDSSFDVATVAFGVRNFEDLEKGLREIARVLKRGGELRVLEFGQPQHWFWRTLFQCYSRLVMPCLGGLLSGNFAAYRYLPETSRVFPCGDTFSKILQTCGFDAYKTRSLSGGIAYLYQARKL